MKEIPSSNVLKAAREAIGPFFDKKAEALEFLYTTLQLFIPNYGNGSIEEIESRWCTLGMLLLPDALPVFESHLVSLQKTILSDAQAILKGDPAAKTLEEVILCYPGFFAVATHRIANTLLRLDAPLLPRLLSEHAHQKTGIDIHPGATIGESFCIDHGTGIVIGETCEIGDNVKIYQGVTLGALSVAKTMAEKKRHPTIGDGVVIYANATLLGPITVGAASVIGGNVWLTESVPEKSKVKSANN